MALPFLLGLKLHSTNTDLIPEAIALWEKNIFQYIELYVIPDSYGTTHEKWKDCKIPFVIHAAHSLHGVNFALSSQENKNASIFHEAKQFADELNVDSIIIHGGHTGTIAETIRQAALLLDSRLVLENKPKVGIKNEKCVGWSPEEFKAAFESNVFKGFVLDFCHAACAAFSVGKKPMDLVNDLALIKPGIFHLSDGDIQSEKDKHYRLGKGTLPLSKFIRVVPKNCHLTLETPRNAEMGLSEFAEDVDFLKTTVNSI